MFFVIKRLWAMSVTISMLIVSEARLLVNTKQGVWLDLLVLPSVFDYQIQNISRWRNADIYIYAILADTLSQSN